MTSRSQVTLFAILGLFIIAIFALLALLSSPFSGLNSDTEPEPVKSFIQSCLAKVSEDGIILLGLKNGLILGQYVNVSGYAVNYAHIDNASVALSVDDMQSQLEEYINRHLPACISDFESFAQFNIAHKSPKAKVQINSRDVSVMLDYDVRYMAGNVQRKFSKFQHHVRVRLRMLQETAERVSNMPHNHIELFAYLGTKDINTTVYTGFNSTVYVLTDTKSRIRDKAYRYIFATG